MTITEAQQLNALLEFLFTGRTEADRDAAEDAVGYLAGRAHTALGAGRNAEQAAARFRGVFPPGWWELPPSPDDPDVPTPAAGEPARAPVAGAR